MVVEMVAEMVVVWAVMKEIERVVWTAVETVSQ